MSVYLLPFEYLAWHYSAALLKLFQLGANFLWFFYHFFSLPVLARTLFSPWRRLDEPYQKAVDLGAWLSTLIVNVLMRSFGFVLRLIIIFFGLFVLGLTLGLIIFLFIFWLTLPAIILSLLIIGFYLLLA